jgi:hypothetical protein
MTVPSSVIPAQAGIHNFNFSGFPPLQEWQANHWKFLKKIISWNRTQYSQVKK